MGPIEFSIIMISKKVKIQYKDSIFSDQIKEIADLIHFSGFEEGEEIKVWEKDKNIKKIHAIGKKIQKELKK